MNDDQIKIYLHICHTIII